MDVETKKIFSQSVHTAQYTMFDEYTKVRGDIALDINTLHTIDTSSSGQVCDTFGLHESLPFLKTLFDNQDLTFFANIGVLQQPTTKLNWSQNHRETALVRFFLYQHCSSNLNYSSQ